MGEVQKRQDKEGEFKWYAVSYAKQRLTKGTYEDDEDGYLDSFEAARHFIAEDVNRYLYK